MTRDKLVPSFGAGHAYPNGLNKARSLGRPPERREVEHSRASAPPGSYFEV